MTWHGVGKASCEAGWWSCHRCRRFNRSAFMRQRTAFRTSQRRRPTSSQSETASRSTPRGPSCRCVLYFGLRIVFLLGLVYGRVHQASLSRSPERRFLRFFEFPQNSSQICGVYVAPAWTGIGCPPKCQRTFRTGRVARHSQVAAQVVKKIPQAHWITTDHKVARTTRPPTQRKGQRRHQR